MQTQELFTADKTDCHNIKTVKSKLFRYKALSKCTTCGWPCRQLNNIGKQMVRGVCRQCAVPHWISSSVSSTVYRILAGATLSTHCQYTAHPPLWLAWEYSITAEVSPPSSSEATTESSSFSSTTICEKGTTILALGTYKTLLHRQKEWIHQTLFLFQVIVNRPQVSIPSQLCP